MPLGMAGRSIGLPVLSALLNFDTSQICNSVWVEVKWPLNLIHQLRGDCIFADQSPSAILQQDVKGAIVCYLGNWKSLVIVVWDMFEARKVTACGITSTFNNV